MKVFVAVTCFVSLTVMLQAPLVLSSRTQASRVLLDPGTVAYGGTCNDVSDCSTIGAVCANKVCTGTVADTGACKTNTDCANTTSSCTPSTNGFCTAQGSVEDKGVCTVDADCSVPDSSCLSNKCSSPGAIPDSGSCKQASDCQTDAETGINATCTNHLCTKPGSVAHGETCTADTDCAATFRCGVKTQKCLAPDESDSLASSSPSPSSTGSTPASPASGNITVVFSATLPAWSVATFKAQQQTNFQNAVLSKATGATACVLSKLHDGSLMLDSTVTFPKSDTNANNAANFKNVLANNVSSIFPTATYGEVKVGNVTSTSGHQGLALSSVVFFTALIIIGMAH